MTTRHPSASPTLIRFGSRPMIAAGFVKRQEQDELFEAVFARAEPRTVLTGMRGSGKTQLAAAVAARCVEEGWPLVAWIHASSRKEIIADLYELALRIGIDAPTNIPLEVIVQRLLAQLRSANGSNSLFVFDNAENPDDLRDLIPEGTGVRTLITTTRHLDWDGLGWLRLTVGPFEREQSITLLCERTGDTHREAADRISDALGDLPVAITQAAATAQQGGYALSGYLDRLSHHPLESSISRLEGDDYPDAVGIALLMAYEQVLEQLRTEHPQQERVAISLLDALSLLAASGVPTHWLLRLDNDFDAVRNTLSFLKSASIFQESTDGDKTIIHRLQGHVYRETYLNNQKKLGEARTCATTVLSGIDVDQRENVEQRRQETHHLIEQLLSVTSQDYSHSLFSEPHVSLKLAETLHCATSLGMSQMALTLTDSVTQACDTLGPHHPCILSPRSELARVYRASGRLDKAITLDKQNLEDSIRILDPTTPAPSPHVARSPAPTGRAAASTTPSPCTSRPSTTPPVSWAPTTPAPSPHATTSPVLIAPQEDSGMRRNSSSRRRAQSTSRTAPRTAPTRRPVTDCNMAPSLMSVGCETVSACGSSTPPTGTWGVPSTGACLMTRTPPSPTTSSSSSAPSRSTPSSWPGTSTTVPSRPMTPSPSWMRRCAA